MSDQHNRVESPHLSLPAQLYVQTVRWAFTRFYREFSWTYDIVAALVSAGFWHDWTVSTQPYLRGRVLEVGCGTGNLQRALATSSTPQASVGFDLSRQMLAHTQRKVERTGSTPSLVRGDAAQLPFPAASFNTVVATFPSEYIVSPQTLAEVRRVLSADGRLIVLLGARLTGDGLYYRLIDIAYRITLQRSPRDLSQTRKLDSPQEARVDTASSIVDVFLAQLLERMRQAGFHPRDQWLAAPGGHVYLIFGEVTHATRCYGRA
ncbi:MAG: class I SAM-dependent methyltransferase [Chloroflexota bacterium]